MDMLPQTVALTPQGYISPWTGGGVNPKTTAPTLHSDKGERQCLYILPNVLERNMGTELRHT